MKRSLGPEMDSFELRREFFRKQLRREALSILLESKSET